MKIRSLASPSARLRARARAAKLSLVALALVVLVGVAGCASHDDGASSAADPASEAPPSADEVAAGHAWSSQDGSQIPADAEPAPHVDSPAEDARPYLTVPEEKPVVDAEGIPIDPSELTATETCHRATGYSHGSPFTICITYIDGKAVEVNTARAYLKMRAAAKRHGVNLYVVSGFRTMAQQRWLYHLYLTGRGNLAAPPGYSNHQSGHALDLNTGAGGVYGFLASHGSAYGFRRTVPSEAWHWEHW